MKGMVDKPIVLHLPSVTLCLPVVRAALAKLCELVGFADDTAHMIVLSVDEALTNIIKHAYAGADDKRIDVELSIRGRTEPEAIEIRLRDYGPGVDPEKIKPRDLDDVRPGGLGTHIIKECMDSVQYSPAEGGGTLLTMIKCLDKSKESPTV